MIFIAQLTFFTVLQYIFHESRGRSVEGNPVEWPCMFRRLVDLFTDCGRTADNILSFHTPLVWRSHLEGWVVTWACVDNVWLFFPDQVAGRDTAW